MGAMKYSLIVLTFAILTRTEPVKLTTLSDEDGKSEVSKEKLNEEPKEALNRSGIYLEDVVFALKSYNWSKEEEKCLNETLSLIRALQNFTLWAVWDWDAIASEPQGLLFGNRYQLGNFDECLHPTWGSSGGVLRTQYCLADIFLERTDHAVKRKYKGIRPNESVLDFIEARPLYSRPLNELTWGACVPASCGPGAVERLIATMLARSHLGSAGMRARIQVTEACQKQEEPREFDALFWTFIAVSAALTITTLTCTYLNCKRDKSKPKTLKYDIIEAFCLKENARNLLMMKKEGIEILYGIRFLTISFIVVDHELGIFNSGAISDGLRVDQDIMSVMGLFVLHDDLFVDTFFLLSGFLTATAFRKFKRFPNPLFFILRRYVRLVVAFAVMVFYVCAVYPYTGSGPLWPKGVAGDTYHCRKNWWLSLLMLNNYIDSEHICIVVSWYIPCDFHFFCLAVLLYWLYLRRPRLASVCAAGISVLALVLPGVINYVYKLPAVQLFTYDFVSNPRASEDFHLTYIKSHTRAGAYIIGFFSGYLFVNTYRENEHRISKKWSITGAISGLVVMVVVLVMGTTFLWRSYHPLEGAVYAALNRPVWTCGVAMLVLCCALGHVPLVKGFLCWYPWVPLSRLSYGLYLTHSIFISRNVFTTRNSQDNDYPELLNAAAGVIVWGCLASLVIWLLTEAPANNLLAIMLRPRNPRATQDKMKGTLAKSEPTSVEGLPSSSSSTAGHLQCNLPRTVQFSSKV